jgi:bifunctional ADP-heptose synthase (sugar kinase/adenylyltransferase)
MLSWYFLGLVTRMVRKPPAPSFPASPTRLGSPVLVNAKDFEYSRYNGKLLLTPHRSEAFIAACYLRGEDAVAVAGGHLMSSIAIDALLITDRESGIPLIERHDSAVHPTAYAYSL